MGKSKKTGANKLQRTMENSPVGLSQAEAARLGDMSVANPGSSFPLLNKLTSPDPMEREWACSGIAHIVIEDPSALKLVVESGALRKLVGLLCDTEPSVATRAAGALQNVSQVDPSVVSPLILQSDACTPLIDGIHKVRIVPEDESMDARTKDQLLSQFINLLTHLVEDVDQTSTIVSQSNIFPSLFSLFNPQLYTQELMVSVATLLNALTEDNQEMLRQFQGDYLNVLKATFANQSNNMCLRMLCVGVLHNVLSSDEDIITLIRMASSSIQALLSQFDPWPAWETIHQAKLEQQNMAEAAKQDSEKAAEIQVQLKKAQHEIYRMIEVWKWNTSAQIYALQFVANVLSGSDPEDDDGQFVELDDAAADQMAGGLQRIQINPEIVKALASSGIFPVIIQKIGFTPAITPLPNVDNEEGDPTSTTSFIETSRNLQTTAFGCLQNIVLSLGSVPNASPTFGDDVAGLWRSLCDICGAAVSPSNPHPIEFLTQVVVSATVILLQLARENMAHGHSIFQPTTDDLAGLQSLSKNQYSEEIRSNAVAALGVIAQMPQSASLMQTFGTLFIEALGDSSSWVFVEAINAIFDAFAEPDHNRVFSDLGMMSKLEQCGPLIRQQIQLGKNRRMDKILLDRLDEARINLPRFIKYKRAQKL